MCRWSAKQYVIPVMIISFFYNYSRFYELEVWSYPITGTQVQRTFIVPSLYFEVSDYDRETNQTSLSNTTYYGKIIINMIFGKNRIKATLKFFLQKTTGLSQTTRITLRILQ